MGLPPPLPLDFPLKLQLVARFWIVGEGGSHDEAYVPLETILAVYAEEISGLGVNSSTRALM